MFQRRKVLLTLLDACGGELTSTDMQKLLFCYCMDTARPHFDFFPHKFGCFSFLSYQDKRVLTSQGYLANVEGFKLRKPGRYMRMAGEESIGIRLFAERMEGLRGRDLVRKVYLSHPYYATRSRIKHEILDSKELATVEAHSCSDTKRLLFTIGYEGLTIDSFINKLIKRNVAMVVDVRRNPLSMKYGFSKTRLGHYLQRADIKYEHIPSLGIESALRQNLKSEKDYTALFKRYAATWLPQRGAEIARVEQLLADNRRIALTCFESDARMCHRHKITERLAASNRWNTPVEHIA